jgi:predicted transcriptional regulator
MIRNPDIIDKTITEKIANNPGVIFSQLLKHLNIPPSTLRYRLITLEMAGIISAKKSRNFIAYYVKNLQE